MFMVWAKDKGYSSSSALKIGFLVCQRCSWFQASRTILRPIVLWEIWAVTSLVEAEWTCWDKANGNSKCWSYERTEYWFLVTLATSVKSPGNHVIWRAHMVPVISSLPLDNQNYKGIVQESGNTNSGKDETSFWGNTVKLLELFGLNWDKSWRQQICRMGIFLSYLNLRNPFKDDLFLYFLMRPISVTWGLSVDNLSKTTQRQQPATVLLRWLAS